MNILGENNPNYGNFWTDEQKRKQSDLIKSKVDDKYRLKCGSANRGKKFSKERIAKMHGGRTKESYQTPKSKEHKKKIGIASKKKWTVEYKLKHRQKMEALGHWIPLEEKTDYQIYFKESDWNQRMFDLFESGILNENGVFNPFTNSKGVVRDHKFSRKSGYILKVPPEILRHVENCSIILHADNVSKGQADSMELEELFDRIKNTQFEWHEQDLCLSLIEAYENGKKWKRRN